MRSGGRFSRSPCVSSRAARSLPIRIPAAWRLVSRQAAPIVQDGFMRLVYAMQIVNYAR
jgi:hypothetical protein